MRNWAKNLHTEAKRLLTKDGTHASLLFLFNKESGLISVNQVPSDVDLNELNLSIQNAIIEHDLYGVVFIGETWIYYMKEKDHTTFQLLDGEMKVSDLNSDDKKEALMIRMENADGDCIVYLDEITRDKNGVVLKDGLINESSQKKWFVQR